MLFLHKGSRFWPLPTNFCGIVLLRLATLLANLSSTKALSDPVWLKSSLCSFWLLSSFITGKQDREVRFRVKVNYCPVKCQSVCGFCFSERRVDCCGTRSTWPINTLWVHARVHVCHRYFNIISFHLWQLNREAFSCSFFAVTHQWPKRTCNIAKKVTVVTSDRLGNLVTARCIAACMHNPSCTHRKEADKKQEKNGVVNLCTCCFAAPCTAGSCDIAPCAPPESCAACNSVRNKHICGVFQLLRKIIRITFCQ